ncbi:MAG TPA: UDP-4-amino-4,6-dideoxy-N-acetyl-beta-L-altrosamine N-acetyltransferase [Phenylobacterium sp.]|nr:UDP-4-amino-4,6-dideoxy-N-acetyl-beta-L-altrosamine N-acetyltransferase [Phenylobacterium sp.]
MSAPRVELRDLRDNDRERILNWRNSPDVRAFMYTDHLISPEEHARWFEGAGRDPRRRYWIIEANGSPVGLANLADIDLGAGRCAWAYYLADPSVRGMGLGSYVEYWMLQEVFERQGLRKLWCEVLVTNEPVWRLHQTFGFVEEARFRQHVIKEGAPVDVLGLGILAEEWRARRPAMTERLRVKGFEPPIL